MRAANITTSVALDQIGELPVSSKHLASLIHEVLLERHPSAERLARARFAIDALLERAKDSGDLAVAQDRIEQLEEEREVLAQLLRGKLVYQRRKRGDGAWQDTSRLGYVGASVNAKYFDARVILAAENGAVQLRSLVEAAMRRNEEQLP